MSATFKRCEGLVPQVAVPARSGAQLLSTGRAGLAPNWTV
jgi:hypothetical protein